MKDLKSDNIFADEEGRALAQIIHDEAPGADLLFHTSIGDSDNAGDPLLNPQGRVKPDIIAPDGISALPPMW